MDLLKAELKAFERDFKAKNGRAPGKADIKAQPEIGESAIIMRACEAYTRFQLRNTRRTA